MEKTNLTPSAILTVVLVLRLKPQGEGVMQILFPKLKLGANYFFFCVFCGYMFSHLVCKLSFLCLLWLYVFSLGVKTISFVFFVSFVAIRFLTRCENYFFCVLCGYIFHTGTLERCNLNGFPLTAPLRSNLRRFVLLPLHVFLIFEAMREEQ